MLSGNMLLALMNYSVRMVTPSNFRNPVALLIAVLVMSMVLFAPANATVNLAVVEHSQHRNMQAPAATSFSGFRHAGHHLTVHEHVQDILAVSPIASVASSLLPMIWRPSAMPGSPFSLDLTPDQPPRS